MESLEFAQTFTCPRCSTEVSERFYGPCDSCRLELRATLGGAVKDVVLADYEPKMNVTPNAVALKDD
jgi:hypothetical protein